MANKFKEIILNTFPFSKETRDVVFKIVTSVKSVAFRLIEEVVIPIPSKLYDVTFKLHAALGKSVAFTLVADSLKSVVFNINTISRSVIFNIREDMSVPKVVIFNLKEGSIEEEDCIPLDC